MRDIYKLLILIYDQGIDSLAEPNMFDLRQSHFQLHMYWLPGKPRDFSRLSWDTRYERRYSEATCI